MRRHELLQELAKHVNFAKNPEVCYMPTAVLRGILTYYKSPREERVAREMPRREGSHLHVMILAARPERRRGVLGALFGRR
jgi:hypothetical protein